MIGRKAEQDELMRMYESNESEFVAIYGRRRVGKTYLVRETFDGQFTFQHSGLAKGGMKRQLANFAVSLKSFGLSGHGTPKNWDEAFVMLREVVAASECQRKVGVFREVTKTRKSIHLTIITSSGLVRNEYSSRIQSEVSLGDLFTAG